jgi:hypothetical protein
MKKSLFNRCQAVIDDNYLPKDRHFTSLEEIEYVSKLMGLSELSAWDLQNLRDMWVLIHTDEMFSKGPKFNYQRFNSVIAVLDIARYDVK